jgi:3-oxoacyl-[acyl-carrier protein] reductase
MSASREESGFIVTGAAGGIGRTTAALLANDGATVLGVDLRESTATWPSEETASQRHSFLAADLTLPESSRRVVEAAQEGLPEITGLINCAGVASRTSIPHVSLEEWNRVMSINLTSVFFLTQAVLPSMIKQGHGLIVNLASAAGKLGGVTVGPHYSAAKAGIICLTKSLAQYGAPHGIRVNAVCPGPIATNMTAEWDRATNEAFTAKIPMHRYGTADEVAKTILFLLSDGAGYITGEIIDVNGGLIMD